MIGPDDIAAFAEDEAALTQAAARINQGVVSYREFPAEDVRRIVRHGMRYREAVLALHDALAEMVERERVRGIEAMGVYDREGHETA